MKSESSSPVGIGAVTILMVLVVLCLSTFGALTFFSARADLRLSQVNADSITAYYNADSQAQRFAADFEASDENAATSTFPIGDRQELLVHLGRNADGSVEIKEWRVCAVSDEVIDDSLPVWDGSIPSE